MAIVTSPIGVCVAAEPDWIDQRQAGPFVIRATIDLSPHAAMIEELPELEKELRRVLALRPCREPLEVLILADEAQHRAYLAERFPEAPYRRALFVKQAGRSTVFLYLHEELAIDMRHECTHALLHADLPMIPLWLDEGLAEYFEMPSDQRAFGNPHQEALRWRLRLGMVEDLKTLEAKQDLPDMELGDYRFAWAWTHFMLHGPREASEELWGFLAAIRRAEPPGPLSIRLEQALPGVDRRLVQHFRSWQKLAKR